MPRAGWKKPDTDRRLSDLVSVGILMRQYPPNLVDNIIDQCGRTEQRHRTLPAQTMAYFALGMALHSEGSYEDILSLMTDGMAWTTNQEPIKLPSKSGIFQARARLGHEPIKALFEQVAKPLATPNTPGSWLAGRRLVAIDGTSLDVADSKTNDEYFGRPGVTRGERSAFPKARLVAVAECGTHAIFDAVVGPYTTSENALAPEVIDRLKPGMLLLADRGFCGYRLWSRAVETGADLLWRARTTMKPRMVEELADGSWLAELRPASGSGVKADPLLIRVVEYTIDDGRQNGEVYRLFTTILDPDVVSAVELAVAYGQRWEIESAFDELKTHQRGARVVLRSKSPDLVLQEVWGHLCCHYAVRTLMFEAADGVGVDPDRVSFVGAIRVVRRSLSAARVFSP